MSHFNRDFLRFLFRWKSRIFFSTSELGTAMMRLVKSVNRSNGVCNGGAGFPSVTGVSSSLGVGGLHGPDTAASAPMRFRYMMRFPMMP